MYEMTHILDEVNFDFLEYGYLTSKTLHSSDTFDLWIPKFMGPLPYGTKKNWNTPMSSPLENDTSCRISHGTSIKFQNFVTVKRHHDTCFEHLADRNDYLAQGTKFLLTCVNADPRDIRILKTI